MRTVNAVVALLIVAMGWIAINHLLGPAIRRATENAASTDGVEPRKASTWQAIPTNRLADRFGLPGATRRVTPRYHESVE